jgi:hypothetical protein
MGIAVFAGMLGVTVFGLFLTPVFYVCPAQAGQPSVGLARAACDRGSGACLIDVDSLISPSSTFS